MSKHESRRAAFEAKCGTRSIDRYSNGSYVDPFVSGAWGGWNAAQDEAEKLRAELEVLRRQIDTLTEWYANGLNVIEECSSVLPGTHYMDPPDGGDVSIPEQLRRMAKDAERYRWARDCGNGSYLYAMIRAGQCGRNMDDAIDEASKVLRKDQSHG